MAVTNFEHYKNEIKDVCYEFGMNKYNNKIEGCSYELCKDCAFSKYTNVLSSCTTARVKWLYQEHKEQPKITQEEYNFLHFLDDEYYVARNKTGALGVYAEKPRKEDDWWYSPDEQLYIQAVYFPFIKWEDEEPWKVTDLSMLEIEL